MPSYRLGNNDCGDRRMTEIMHASDAFMLFCVDGCIAWYSFGVCLQHTAGLTDKKLRRREQNRRAATKCRNKRRAEYEQLKKVCSHTLQFNSLMSSPPILD